MLKNLRLFVGVLLLLLSLPMGLEAQEYVYTNNDLAAGNSVSVFTVDTNGALQLTGSYLTGGLGAGTGPYAPNRIIVVGDFLYVSNAGSNSVSAFTINTSNGALTAVSATPYAIQGSSSSTFPGISLAATPNGQFLYAGATGGTITIFGINTSTAALAPVSSGTGVAAGGTISSMKVSPDGKYLAVVLYPFNAVAMFAIQSDGTLQSVTNSPFYLNAGTGYAAGIDINCASSKLFAGRSGPDIDVLNIDSGGSLTELSNSPFTTSNATGTVLSNQVVALSTDDNTLFSSNQGGNTVTAYPLGTDGTLTGPGTSAYVYDTAIFPPPTTSPAGIAVSKDGNFLYSADAALGGGTTTVTAFGLAGTAPISLDSALPTGQNAGLRSIAAYPAKTCASSTASSSLTASLQITAGPPPGFTLDATLALDSSLAVDPLTQAVTIQVGSYAINLPAGSFKSFQNGTNSAIYLFQGVVNSTTLKVQVAPLGQNQFQFSVYDKQIDLTTLPNPITVTVGIGGNSASTSVDANFGTFAVTPFHR